ncbi:Splicing factor SF3a60 [Zea mays]|uniref:Splicing factor SF3a60 n=2 Tax=Zea mays TaxID=4577 RepID=A0A3L6DYB4_MAIZE|nr:Splicing factor SF3a60-like protein [Zea mays]PWZ12887.1 Splicing factor SF3a60 [Zea mays]
MASTVLEATRVAHEDLERLERLAARELQWEPDNPRDRFFQSHRVRHMLDLVVSTSCKLLKSEFEERWANGEIPGWGNKGAENESKIDLDYYSTVETGP